MCLCLIEVETKRSVTWLPRFRTGTKHPSQRTTSETQKCRLHDAPHHARLQKGGDLAVRQVVILGGSFRCFLLVIWSLMSFEIYHYSAVSNKVLDRGPCKVQITKFLWQLCMIVYFSRGDRLKKHLGKTNLDELPHIMLSQAHDCG